MVIHAALCKRKNILVYVSGPTVIIRIKYAAFNGTIVPVGRADIVELALIHRSINSEALV